MSHEDARIHNVEPTVSRSGIHGSIKYIVNWNQVGGWVDPEMDSGIQTECVKRKKKLCDYVKCFWN
jgi:hypothetical protein